MKIGVVLNRLQGDIRAAKRLAADAESQRILTHDFVNYPLLKATHKPLKPIERTVRLKGDVVLSYRGERGDIWAVRQMWVDEVCKLPVQVAPDVVVDLGANIGMAGVYLAKRYGCASLIAVEPVAENIALARKNYAQNGIDAFVYEGVVGDTEGTAQFVMSIGSGNGRIDFQRTTHNPATVSVPMTTMERLLNDTPQNQMILVKMDIEGAEQQVLQNRPNWLHRISALLLECHPPLANEAELTEIVTASGMKCHSLVAPLTPFFVRSKEAEQVVP